MNEGPHIARIAGLIGEPARAAMLAALMDGRALTATELAALGRVTRATASVHLGRLLDARLVAVQAQGRHRYYRLADADVARLLENLMGVAARAGARTLLPGPREPALRAARQCYDHLAGDAGVALYEGLLAADLLKLQRGEPRLTRAGRQRLAGLGLDVDALAAGRRPLLRTCLDWSARRHHLAGALGAALLKWLQAAGGARRLAGTRALAITPAGQAALRALLAPPAKG